MARQAKAMGVLIAEGVTRYIHALTEDPRGYGQLRREEATGVIDELVTNGLEAITRKAMGFDRWGDVDTRSRMYKLVEDYAYRRAETLVQEILPKFDAITIGKRATDELLRRMRDSMLQKLHEYAIAAGERFAADFVEHLLEEAWRSPEVMATLSKVGGRAFTEEEVKAVLARGGEPEQE